MWQTCKIWKSLTFNRQAVALINGAGKGPVTSATIKGLFDNQVRRKGMSESKSLRQRICVNLRIHPECAAGCQDQSRSAQGGQARIDYLNSGMRKEMRTEFKRITRVYEEFHSEKNIRTRHLGERRYAHGNHAVAA